MRAQLMPISGGEPIEVTKELTVVGRKEECDVQLDHKSVSKLHCVIVKTDGLLLVRDLGSTNGTRVNGQRIRRAALLPNDKLTIANYTFKILFGSALGVSQHEHTQQIGADEVAPLEPAADMHESSDEMPVVPIQQQLPDVYPEDEQKAK